MIYKFEIDDTIVDRVMENIAKHCGWRGEKPPTNALDKETKRAYAIRMWREYPLRCTLVIEPDAAASTAENAKKQQVKDEIIITESQAAEPK